MTGGALGFVFDLDELLNQDAYLHDLLNTCCSHSAALDANQMPAAGCDQARLLLTQMPRDGLLSCVHQFEVMLMVGLHLGKYLERKASVQRIVQRDILAPVFISIALVGRTVVPLSTDGRKHESFGVQYHNLLYYFENISSCVWTSSPGSLWFSHKERGSLQDVRKAGASRIYLDDIHNGPDISGDTVRAKAMRKGQLELV